MNQLAQINRILIFIVLIVVILYFGAAFLIPFIFGVLFTFLMVPLCKLLEKIKINRTIASLISTLLLFIVFGGIIFLFTTQFNKFLSDVPSIEDKVSSFIESSQNKIESITNLSLGEQNVIMKERSGQIIEKIEPVVTGFFGSVFSTIFGFFMIMIYVFLLLLYRKKIFEFLMMYIKPVKEESAKDTLTKISKVAFHYLWGRVQVMILLGILFYITFILFGLPYALLFTLFGTIITVIPYFGPLISGLLPILFSFVYFDSMQKILLFSAIVFIIQLIESYVFEPLILGKEVKLNPMIIIIAIILGGLLWGIAGMILFVPIFAIVKIISCNYSGLKPIEFIMGHGKKEDFDQAMPT
jgi:predicted PurR-regulated permease PerM